MTTTDTAARAPLGRDPPRDARAGPPRPSRRGRGLSRYPESPSPRVYGEDAAADGQAAFEAHLGEDYRGWPASRPTARPVGSEVSPYGPELRVRYPRLDVDAAMAAARAAMPALARRRRLSPRRGLRRDRRPDQHARRSRSRNAVMHTSGQPFVMSFQAGGPHAQDRALEAVALRPGRAGARARLGGLGEAGQGRADADARRTTGSCRAAWPWSSAATRSRRGTATRACSPRWPPATPSWSSRTRGPCCRWRSASRRSADGAARRRVRPGPGARWRPRPTARGWRRRWPQRPEVAIIDYTGGPAFGGWLEREAAADGKQVYTEKSGVNTIVRRLDRRPARRPGQPGVLVRRCTAARCARRRRTSTSRADGIDTDEGHLSFERGRREAGRAISRLTGDDAKAVEMLGATVNDDVRDRAAGAGRAGASGRRHGACSTRAGSSHPRYPDAVVRTPGPGGGGRGASESAYTQECFGPVTFLVATDSTAQSLQRSARHGPRARRDDGRGLLDVRGGARRRPGRGRRRRGRAVARTSPARCSSTRPRRSATSTAPAPTRPPTPRTPTAAFVANRFRVVTTRRHV